MLGDKRLRKKLGDFGEVGQWSNGPCVDKGVLKYIKNKFDIKTMVDVGCGEGKQVEYARNMGIHAVGVDGCPALSIYKKLYFVRHNYVLGKADIGEFDLCWSVEFVEHVHEQYVPNFMDTFARCRFLICTHAIPGQRGKHHVNCQEKKYWIDVCSKSGLEYDAEETDIIKNMAKMSHIREKGLFFRNVSKNG